MKSHFVFAQVLDGARQQRLTASRIGYVRNGPLEFGLRFGALLQIEICWARQIKYWMLCK